MNIKQIPIKITAEVGYTEMKLTAVEALGEGGVIEFKNLVTESLIIKANGQPFAKGEIVTVNDKMAIRVTEILTVEQQQELSFRKEIVPYGIVNE